MGILLQDCLRRYQKEKINHYNKQKSEDYGTYSDPKIAFRETQKALAMISESVNKGIGSMNYLNEFEQSKNRIFKK